MFSPSNCEKLSLFQFRHNFVLDACPNFTNWQFQFKGNLQQDYQFICFIVLLNQILCRIIIHILLQRPVVFFYKKLSNQRYCIEFWIMEILKTGRVGKCILYDFYAEYSWGPSGGLYVGTYSWLLLARRDLLPPTQHSLVRRQGLAAVGEIIRTS